MGDCILLARTLENILKNPSSIDKPLYESATVVGFPDLRMKITKRWNSQGSMVGVSPNKRSLPNWTRMEEMNGDISLIRALENPRGPGQEFVLRSLMMFLISISRTGEIRRLWLSGRHFLRDCRSSGPRTRSMVMVLACGSG